MGGDVGCFAKRKLKSEIGENEEAIKKGDAYEPIYYVWAFKILGAKYHEQEGRP